MDYIHKKLELLAPVGSFDGLRAAVANGADAIYVGGPAFGARKEAAFTHEELVAIIEFCHLYGVFAYVTINTTVFDDEIRELENYLHFLYTNGADAVIVSDIGVAQVVRRLYPDFELHISTQAHVHNTEAVQFFKKIGANRIVATRENDLNEIAAMSAVGLDVEVFVHGALCFCYSGQCLMSSMFGGRSGNRGACAQPCRLAYDLINLETNTTLTSEIGNYLISPRDLNTAENIGQLIEAGARSFKIEGRLKKPEYVATVVKAYRTAIDQYLTTGTTKLAPELTNAMTQVFNRTFTQGFLHGESGRDWLGADRPGHRGLMVGVVTNVKGNRATVKLNSELDLHDGVRFVGKQEFGMQVQKLFVNRLDVKSALKGEVDLICNFTPTVGMKVYKTTSKKLTDELAITKMPPIRIDGQIMFKIGQPLKLTIIDQQNNQVTKISAEPVQIAENTGLTAERLQQQISKTGSTPFIFDELVVDADEQATIPIATINQLRRESLEELEAKRKNWHQARIFSTVELAFLPPQTRDNSSVLTASVRNLDQLAVVCVHESIGTIYYQHLPTLKQALEIANQQNKTLIPQIPRVMDDAGIKMVKTKLKELGIETVLVGEYGMFGALIDDFTVLTDHGFNTNNGQTLTAFAEFGGAGCTLSYELTGSKIRKLAKNTPLPLEQIVFTKTPLMITKHCPLKTHYQTESGACQGKYCQTPHGLRDRKGAVLPMLRSGKCKIEIFNDQPLNLLAQLVALSEAGISRFRLEFTTETVAEINAVITAFTTIDLPWLATQKHTTGHYHRGVSNN